MALLDPALIRCIVTEAVRLFYHMNEPQLQSVLAYQPVRLPCLGNAQKSSYKTKIRASKIVKCITINSCLYVVANDRWIAENPNFGKSISGINHDADISVGCSP